MDDHHPEFQGSLPPAHQVELFVGRWLESRDNTDIVVHEKRIAPTLADRKEYADSGDLEWVSKDGVPLRGEVKGSGHCFTPDPSEFSWPTRIWIDRVETCDAKDPPPDWYFIVSKDRKTIISVSCQTKPDWGKAYAQHRFTKIWNETYTTRLIDVDFHDSSAVD